MTLIFRLVICYTRVLYEPPIFKLTGCSPINTAQEA